MFTEEEAKAQRGSHKTQGQTQCHDPLFCPPGPGLGLVFCWPGSGPHPLAPSPSVREGFLGEWAAGRPAGAVPGFPACADGPF